LFKPFITNAEVYAFKRLVVTNPVEQQAGEVPALKRGYRRYSY
jgi:hypothetical protein